jgi:hypothetical protein
MMGLQPVARPADLVSRGALLIGKVLFPLGVAIILAGSASAGEVAGVNLERSVAVNGHVLKLKGCALRNKFFVSFNTARSLPRIAQALRYSGDRLIRMNFLHSKVDREQIVEAFNDGFANNSPDLAGSAEAK